MDELEDHWQVVQSGRITVAETAEELWNNACKYFAWCRDNPIITKKRVSVGKDAGKEFNDTSTRPFTIKGLCIHCGIVEDYLNDIRQTKNKDSEYYLVVSKILYIIFTQNAEMATIGVFNPIFTSKMLNMENDDTPAGVVRVEIVPGLPTLAKSENEILEKIESEIADRKILEGKNPEREISKDGDLGENTEMDRGA